VAYLGSDSAISSFVLDLLDAATNVACAAIRLRAFLWLKYGANHSFDADAPGSLQPKHQEPTALATYYAVASIGRASRSARGPRRVGKTQGTGRYGAPANVVGSPPKH
jgi:hypothetical protein